MDMLFGLVAGKMLTLEKATEITNMDYGEALDMLNGWKIVHSGK